ncbi:MAG: hypothetical protein IJK81_05735 [Selenomonadaceae bacterium]|nr:hypothetical protein [Selenomonadaceae bacterium]
MDDKKINDDDLYSVEDSDEDELYAKEISIEKPAKISDEPIKKNKPRTFHSKHFMDTQNDDSDKPKRKRKLSHAEASGVVISTVMLIYSIVEEDKPLFFLSSALLIFLLRPIIGALAGKHNRAVQNALHSFSIVLFIGALLFLFM